MPPSSTPWPSPTFVIMSSAAHQGLVVVGGEPGVEADDDLRPGPDDRLVVVGDADVELGADQGLVVVRVDAHWNAPCRFCWLLSAPPIGACGRNEGPERFPSVKTRDCATRVGATRPRLSKGLFLTPEDHQDRASDPAPPSAFDSGQARDGSPRAPTRKR